MIVFIENTSKTKVRHREKVLYDNAVFYDLIQNELHDFFGVDVYSDEPAGSNFSCFDYSNEGDDNYSANGRENNYEKRHSWCYCSLTKQGDVLYWKSRSGKNAGLWIYAIVKAELSCEHIRLWVAPVDQCSQMGVVDFYRKKS